jgi:2-dehydro-3-deoxyphosphogluconate aldolase/(4S)-4-hydroxy-2-oxoglutarate aldolase
MAVGQASTTAERLRRGAVAETIRRDRAVAILRRLPPAEVDGIAEAVLAGGFTAIEFTVDSEGVEETIARWRAADRSLVGAGTVRVVEEVDLAAEAGAQFLVSPTYDEAVVERALELGLPCIPGALAPSEIDRAWRQGATFVKLFPGGVVGPAYLRAVLNPLKDVEIVVTGGVDETTARSFFDAGAIGVAVSTAQLDDSGGPAAVEAATKRLLASI